MPDFLAFGLPVLLETLKEIKIKPSSSNLHSQDLTLHALGSCFLKERLLLVVHKLYMCAAYLNHIHSQDRFHVPRAPNTPPPTFRSSCFSLVTQSCILLNWFTQITVTDSSSWGQRPCHVWKTKFLPLLPQGSLSP